MTWADNACEEFFLRIGYNFTPVANIISYNLYEISEMFVN